MEDEKNLTTPSTEPTTPPATLPETTGETLTVVPSDVPPVAPSINLTLEEIHEQALAIQAQKDAQPKTPEQTTPEPPAMLVHTYQDDLARSMNVSDAKIVQELLVDARERELLEKLELQNKKARGWYITGSIILMIVALGALGYGIYHYTRLTVPVVAPVSVGVFPSSDPIVASTTTIDQVIARFATDPTLTQEKPYLVDLVSDPSTQALLTNSALFSFIGAAPSEPFILAISALRLGIMDTGSDLVPFLILSVPDSEIALKEFLIAEPGLLEMFKHGLDISTESIAPETTTTFTGEYRYNVPVRTLYTTDVSGYRNLTMLYASVTENIIVVTKDPAVLKAVYDTVIRQN